MNQKHFCIPHVPNIVPKYVIFSDSLFVWGCFYPVLIESGLKRRYPWMYRPPLKSNKFQAWRHSYKKWVSLAPTERDLCLVHEKLVSRMDRPFGHFLVNGWVLYVPCMCFCQYKIRAYWGLGKIPTPISRHIYIYVNIQFINQPTHTVYDFPTCAQ